MSDGEETDPEEDLGPVNRLIRSTTPRERLIGVASSTLSGIGMFWVGLASVPDAALAVPKRNVSQRYGPEIVDALFLPIPDWAIPMTLIGLLAGLYVSWHAYRVRFDDEEGSGDV